LYRSYFSEPAHKRRDRVARKTGRFESTIGETYAEHGGKVWRMAPSKVDAKIAVGQKPEVQVEEEELTSVPETISVPPFSVSIYAFAVQ
jgi:hypothetical protein